MAGRWVPAYAPCGARATHRMASCVLMCYNKLLTHLLCHVGEGDCWRGSWVHWTPTEHWRWRGSCQAGPWKPKLVPDGLPLQDAQRVITGLLQSPANSHTFVAVDYVFQTVTVVSVHSILSLIHCRACVIVYRMSVAGIPENPSHVAVCLFCIAISVGLLVSLM